VATIVVNLRLGDLGSDSNPCTRISPCLTFAAALAQTGAGGEIDVLDFGDFGTVVITKAIIIFGNAVGGAGVMNIPGTRGHQRRHRRRDLFGRTGLRWSRCPALPPSCSYTARGLRRATAVESGLFQIQGEILREIKQAPGTQTRPHDRSVHAGARVGDGSSMMRPYPVWDNRGADYEPRRQRDGEDDLSCATEPPHGTNAEIGRCFWRLSNLGNGAFDRLSRYETAIWRQVGRFSLRSTCCVEHRGHAKLPRQVAYDYLSP
jgi:hypothetical protein